MTDRPGPDLTSPPAEPWSVSRVALAFVAASLALAVLATVVYGGLDVFGVPMLDDRGPPTDMRAELKSIAGIVLFGMLMFLLIAGAVYALGRGLADLYQRKTQAMMMNRRIGFSFMIFSCALLSLLLAGYRFLVHGDTSSRDTFVIAFPVAFVGSLFLIGVLGMVIERRAPGVWTLLESRAYTPSFGRAVNFGLSASVLFFILVQSLLSFGH